MQKSKDMTERIKNALELQKKQIVESEHLSQDEKLQLTELVSEAAECTNGYDGEDKVQRVAETTFHVTTAMTKVMQQLAENNDLTKELDYAMKQSAQKDIERDQMLNQIISNVKKVATVVQSSPKRDIKDLNWKDTIKLVLVKPWIWVFFAIFVFSPKCIELVHLLIDKFKLGN